MTGASNGSHSPSPDGADIALVLHTDQELATILEHHHPSLQEKLLADSLAIVIADEEAPDVHEVYREKVAPDEAKRLEGFTFEVVLGKL